MTNTKTTKHSKYNINDHIVFCPKYRQLVFKKVCSNYGYELIEQEIMPDHMHLFISAPPTVAPIDIVRKLKSISANYIFKTFPNLKKTNFWGSGLWSRGYYVGTAGSISSETIQKYIQNQKNN